MVQPIEHIGKLIKSVGLAILEKFAREEVIFGDADQEQLVDVEGVGLQEALKLGLPRLGFRLLKKLLQSLLPLLLRFGLRFGIQPFHHCLINLGVLMFEQGLKLLEPLLEMSGYRMKPEHRLITLGSPIEVDYFGKNLFRLMVPRDCRSLTG
jgi:hypothetical protein